MKRNLRYWYIPKSLVKNTVKTCVQFKDYSCGGEVILVNHSTATLSNTSSLISLCISYKVYSYTFKPVKQFYRFVFKGLNKFLVLLILRSEKIHQAPLKQIDGICIV